MITIIIIKALVHRDYSKRIHAHTEAPAHKHDYTKLDFHTTYNRQQKTRDRRRQQHGMDSTAGLQFGEKIRPQLTGC